LGKAIFMDSKATTDTEDRGLSLEMIVLHRVSSDRSFTKPSAVRERGYGEEMVGLYYGSYMAEDIF